MARATVALMGSSHERFLSIRHFASLDGLRCLSILPVIWHHSTARQLDGWLGRGPLGVHLFFAISGFLITTLLLRERSRSQAVDLKGFYLRRALRIFPLYYLVLGLYIGRALLFAPGSREREHFFQSLPWYASYTGNWLVDYGVSHPIVFGFSWSLATEEQFYLFWPLCLALSRGWRLPLAAMTTLFALDFAAERGLLGLEAGLSLSVLTSISAPICLGALLALGLHWKPSFGLFRAILGRRASAPLALVTLAACIGIDGVPLLCTHLAMVALVGAVCIRADHGLGRPLELRPVAYVGLVSYGLYLWHMSAITAVRLLFPGASALEVFALATPTALAIATLSYRWFERPFLRLKERLRERAAPRPAPVPSGQYAAS